MSSSLLLQQYPACLVRLTRMVCEIGDRWPYSCFLVGCYFHDLFRITRNILVQLPSSLFSRRLVRVQVVQLYSSTDTTTAWKNCRFNFSVRSDFSDTGCCAEDFPGTMNDREGWREIVMDVRADCATS